MDGKTLLTVEVFLSGTRPHYLKSAGIEQGAYVRLGSTNRQADAQLIAELQRVVAGVSFDAIPMPGLSADALDMKALQRDFEDRRPVDERMLQRLRILVADQGRILDIEKHDAVSRLLDFDPSRGDFTTPEQTVPSRGVPGVDWEQCMTMTPAGGSANMTTPGRRPGNSSAPSLTSPARAVISSSTSAPPATGRRRAGAAGNGREHGRAATP